MLDYIGPPASFGKLSIGMDGAHTVNGPILYNGNNTTPFMLTAQCMITKMVDHLLEDYF